MDKFIKKEQFNYIKREVLSLDSTLRGCSDKNVIEVSKQLTNDKIKSIFRELTEEEKEFLDLSKANNSRKINDYIEKINEHVYGMPDISEAQIKKAFRGKQEVKTQEVKKVQNKPLVYIGWRNIATNRLYVIYHMNGKFEGMECSIVNNNESNKYRCALCNCVGSRDDVSFVSVVCKNTKNGGINNYKSIGFSICLDSEACNDRINDASKLESIMQTVKGRD